MTFSLCECLFAFAYGLKFLRLLPDFVLFLSSHFTCPKIEELPIPPAQRKVLNVFRTTERAVTMASHRKRMAGCARAVKTNRPCIRPARPDIKFQYLDHMPRFTYASNNINAFYSWIMDHRARFGLIDLFLFFFFAFAFGRVRLYWFAFGRVVLDEKRCVSISMTADRKGNLTPRLWMVRWVAFETRRLNRVSRGLELRCCRWLDGFPFWRRCQCLELSQQSQLERKRQHNPFIFWQIKTRKSFVGPAFEIYRMSRHKKKISFPV